MWIFNSRAAAIATFVASCLVGMLRVYGILSHHWWPAVFLDVFEHLLACGALTGC